MSFIFNLFAAKKSDSATVAPTALTLQEQPAVNPVSNVVAEIALPGVSVEEKLAAETNTQMEASICTKAMVSAEKEKAEKQQLDTLLAELNELNVQVSECLVKDQGFSVTHDSCIIRLNAFQEQLNTVQMEMESVGKDMQANTEARQKNTQQMEIVRKNLEEKTQKVQQQKGVVSDATILAEKNLQAALDKIQTDQATLDKKYTGIHALLTK